MAWTSLAAQNPRICHQGLLGQITTSLSSDWTTKPLGILGCFMSAEARDGHVGCGGWSLFSGGGRSQHRNPAKMLETSNFRSKNWIVRLCDSVTSTLQTTWSLKLRIGPLLTWPRWKQLWKVGNMLGSTDIFFIWPRVHSGWSCFCVFFWGKIWTMKQCLILTLNQCSCYLHVRIHRGPWCSPTSKWARCICLIASAGNPREDQFSSCQGMPPFVSISRAVGMLHPRGSCAQIGRLGKLKVFLWSKMLVERTRWQIHHARFSPLGYFIYVSVRMYIK